jgi:geranylgeranyl pyrophosphate synthase
MNYAKILVQTHLERTISELSHFGESEAKQHMLRIAEYVMERKM